MYPFGRSKTFIILFPTLLLAVVLSGILWYINSIDLVSLNLIAPPEKSEYVVGESFSNEGIVLEAHYSFGITRPVEYFTHNVPERFSEVGTFQYYALFIDRGISKITSFEVTVVPKVLTNLVLESLPFQTTYVVGQQLNQSGLTLQAEYNDRIYEPININNANLEILAPSFDVVASNLPVYVRFTINSVQKQVTFNINISTTEMLAISTRGHPFKTTYVQTEFFSADGMEVLATYNNGNTEVINTYTTNYNEIVGEVGNNVPLTITYTEGLATFSTQIFINIVAKQITEVSFVMPNKNFYYVNEEFEPTGMQVVAFYNDLTFEEISLQDVSSDFLQVVSRAGDNKPVVFNYLGYTNQFLVQVKNHPLSSELFMFQEGIITGLSPDAYSLQVITLPKSINGIDVVSARIPKEANMSLDNGSLILDLSYATKLKTLLLEQNVPVQLDFAFPATLTNIFVLSNAYSTNPNYNSALIKNVSNYYSFNAGTNTISVNKAVTPKITDLLVPGYWIDGTPVLNIGDFASSNAFPSFITTIGIAEGITQINDLAFNDSGTTNTNTVRIIALPNSLLSIGANAFSRLNNLERIYFSKNLATINNSAFNGTTNLKEFIVDPQNQYFTTDSGFLLSKDKKILHRYADKSPYGTAIPSEVEIIDNHAFGSSSTIFSIVMPAGVTEIRTSAFSSSSITSLQFESGSMLTTIGSNVFSVSRLQEITIPSNVTTMGTAVFFQCGELENVVFETTLLTEIPGSSFYFCRNIQSISLPSGIRFIRSSAFYGATSLEVINFPDSLEGIDSSAFYNCSAIVFMDLKDIQNIGSSTFSGCTGLQTINIGLGSSFSSIDGVLLNGAGTTIILYPLGRTNPVYSVPNGVLTIGESAFASALLLEEINTNQVVTINRNAFNNCVKLSNVIMGASLTTINEAAFANCTALKTLDIGSNVSNIDTSFVNGTPIEAFSVVSNAKFATDANGVLFQKIGGINKILYRYPTHKGITIYSIPASVTAIGRSAFENALILQQVSSQGIIQTIGERAFYNAQTIGSLFSLANLEDSNDSLGAYAFYNMKGLNSLNLQLAQTKNIKDSTFDGCSNLASITLPSNVKELGSNLFRGTLITTINVPASVTKVYDTFFGATGITVANCYATSPPTYEGTTTLFATGKDAPAATLTINVPSSGNAYLAYQTAAGWTRYASKIRAVNF